MVKFKVYTQQVNQDVYEIDVPESFPKDSWKEYAINKTKEKWRKDYGSPEIILIETVKV